MKTVVLAIFHLLHSITFFSQEYQWAFRIGYNDVQTMSGYAIATDASGNVYVTGYFYGICDFDPGAGTANITSGAVPGDLFVAKYSSTGTYQWAFKVGPGSAERGYGIALDGSNNAYVTGFFSGTCDFDPGAGTVNLVSNSGSYDIFVAKYSSAGAYQWAFKLGPAGTDYAYGVAIDGSDNVYVTGTFSGAADFDPGGGTNTLTPVGGDDIFVAKYSSAGAHQWAFNLGSTGGDIGYSIAIDGSNNVFVTGDFAGTTDFDPGGATVNLSPVGSVDIFLAKYSSAGAYQWAFNIGAAGNTSNGRGVAIDGSDNACITGYFRGAPDFDPGAGTASLSATLADIYVAKYASDGTYQWAFNLGSTGIDYGYGIAVDGSDNIYVTGQFPSTIDFDPGAGTANLTATAADIFAAKYSSSGAYIWAFRAGNAFSNTGWAVATNGSNRVHLTGALRGTADFDPGAATNNVVGSGAPSDIFVSGYGAFALPIELLSFSAYPENNNLVRCHWSTASEINNYYFDIERSRDAINFSQIGTVHGAGNSTVVIKYEFDDMAPFSGLSYYRLKQVDFDGQFSYSNIEAVYIGELEIINIYPNPSQNSLKVQLAIEENTEAEIEAVNALGQTVIHEKKKLFKGYSEIEWDISFLAAGNYLFRVTLPNKEYKQKVFVR